MNDKIAVSMIVRGNDEEIYNIRRALHSIRPHVDAAFVTVTGEGGITKRMEEVAKEFNVQLSTHRPLWRADKKAIKWLKEFFKYDPYMKEGDEVFLFDEARNYNMGQIPKEYGWIVWIDADDVFRNGHNLRPIVQEGLKKGVEAFYFEYLYQVEAEEVEGGLQMKHVIIKHLRERLIRNSGVYKWIAPIHETLIEQKPTVKTDNYDCDVVHLATDEDRLKSLTRNLKNLELAVYRSKGEDPRHLYYLAKAYFDMQKPEYDDKAITLIYRYTDGDENGQHRSGWPEERAQAYEYLSDIYKRKEDFDKAIRACMLALVEAPDMPTIYLNLATCYMYKQQWERALFWVRLASHIPDKATTLVVNPKDMQARTLEVIYNCAVNMSKVDEAWAAAQKLYELFPENPQVVNCYNFANALKNNRDVTKYIVFLAEHLKKSGEHAKIKALLASAPQAVENNPFIINLFQQNNPPTPWGEDEITIYCGPGFTNWSPKRLAKPMESFVGGSEEAVIHISRELQKKGWKVTVYADPGVDEGEYDGVKWLPYYKFNRQDNFNILIGWRDIRFFDADFKAKKKYLWCHDIQNPLEFTKERQDRIDKVFFLSEWHKDNVPDLPDGKVMVTSNGI